MRKKLAVSLALAMFSSASVLASDLQLAFNFSNPSDGKLNNLNTFLIPPALPKSISQPAFQSQYTIDDMCAKIANKLGSVRMKDCQGKGLDYAGGHSVKGLPIIVKEFPPLGDKAPLARVLVIGGIHGDEYSSVSIVFKWMNILNRYHSGLFHWKMVPVMNPDGLLRKKSQRMNDRGVDLNRNFPTPNWRAESHKYWIYKTKRNPRRYPGPAPLSEPESQWLAEYIDDFKPDVIVSIHAPFGILDFDGPTSAPNKFGKLHLRLLGTYPGSLGNYAGKHQELPVVTVELPYAGIMPSRSEVRNIWVDLVRWLRKSASESQQQASNAKIKEKQVGESRSTKIQVQEKQAQVKKAQVHMLSISDPS